MPRYRPLRTFVRPALVVLLVGGACRVPDRPSQLPDPLPRDFLDYVVPDTVRTVRVAEGVWYRYVWSPRGPWAIHLVEADLVRCDLGLEVARAPKQEGKLGGHARVTTMVAEGRPGALVAVNGDFFTPEGTPLGPEVTGESMRTLRARPVVGWRPGGDPWIGTAGVEGGELALGPWRPGTGDAEWTAVVGGYPELLDRGARVGDLLVSENPGFARARHPRTAVGYEADRDVLWLVVVDGRQGDYSLGMTLPELASVFESLGVPEALNLDGGGSSVMVVRGRAASRPSDEGGERAVVNALVLVNDPEFCARGRSARESLYR